ncbi:MAG: DPP IV N-terminal domain-containing protein [Bacteroidota bacterium]
MKLNSSTSLVLVGLLFLLFTTPLQAQEQVSSEDYARAEKFLYSNTAPLVYNASIRPVWVDSKQFWFRDQSKEGTEFVLVNADSETREPAFNHKKIAASLSELTGAEIKPNAIPIRSFGYSEDGKSIEFSMRGKDYICNREKGDCMETELNPHRDYAAIESPDGKLAAFIQDHNLWVRDLEDGSVQQLTTDGIEDFGYATNNAGWTKSTRPVLTWSPDSRMIATFQHDARGVGEMYMVSTNVGHPKLYQWKYPLPEDSVIFRIHRVVIHVEDAKTVRLDMEPDQHRSTITDHIALRDGSVSDLEWSADSKHLAFVSSSRDHKSATLRVADPFSGKVRTVLNETVDTFFESGYNAINWRVLRSSNEVLWYSQRYDWGHLYLYDLETGELKSEVTAGNWNVLNVLRVDEESREIYFMGAGKEDGNPYYQYLYRVSMDPSGERQQAEDKAQRIQVDNLSPINANHSISLSPDGNYFVDTYSTAQKAPAARLLNLEGKELMKLAEADISELEASGWIAPESFTVKARDGETDIHGLMFKPSNFDPNKKYPIINYIYPGPQSGSIFTYGFLASRGDKQSIAELGFIVVSMNAMGTPMRSKSFHTVYYGNMGDNGLPDQVAGMKQLAERHAWIDIDRVGIYGHSGGGFASTAAMFRYPDFFDVAVSGAGNHDNRNYEDDWGEKWQGLLGPEGEGTNYDNQANQLVAKNLKGKLLLAHGTLDGNVPVYNTLLVVDALIAADKDFDLILFPNRGHGFGNETYMLRRRWDYFVEHLLGQEPPEFSFKASGRRR